MFLRRKWIISIGSPFEAEITRRNAVRESPAGELSSTNQAVPCSQRAFYHLELAVYSSLPRTFEYETEGLPLRRPAPRGREVAGSRDWQIELGSDAKRTGSISRASKTDARCPVRRLRVHFSRLATGSLSETGHGVVNGLGGCPHQEAAEEKGQPR